MCPLSLLGGLGKRMASMPHKGSSRLCPLTSSPLAGTRTIPRRVASPGTRPGQAQPVPSTLVCQALQIPHCQPSLLSRIALGPDVLALLSAHPRHFSLPHLASARSWALESRWGQEASLLPKSPACSWDKLFQDKFF